MLGYLFCKLYGVKWPFFGESIRRIILKIIHRIEGSPKAGGAYSRTLRRIMKDYYDVEIGMYTRGACFEPGCAERFTKIGRYCAVARDVRIITINHPMKIKSMHEFFWHPGLKVSKKDLREWSPITIGNDVWIGHGAIILPNVTEIGDGAVIAARAVVNKNIPPYAVVVGNPARVVRYRFSKDVIKELLESKWWEKDIDEIKPFLQEYQQDYEKLYFQKKGGGRESDENSNEHNQDAQD